MVFLLIRFLPINSCFMEPHQTLILVVTDKVLLRINSPSSYKPSVWLPDARIWMKLDIIKYCWIYIWAWGISFLLLMLWFYLNNFHNPVQHRPVDIFVAELKDWTQIFHALECVIWCHPTCWWYWKNKPFPENVSFKFPGVLLNHRVKIASGLCILQLHFQYHQL